MSSLHATANPATPYARRVALPASIDDRPPPPGAVVRELGGLTMGTRWSVCCAVPRALDLAVVQQGVERRLQEVIEQMSTWEPGSLLCLYGAAPGGSWHALPTAFFTVLQAALHVAEASGGAFDPTAAPLVDAWGFGPRGQDEAAAPWPSDTQLASALPACGWRRLELDADRRRLQQPGGCRLDFSAIAKGFAVDHVSRYLEQLGLHDHLVEIGGELRGSGVKPDGQPWWTAIEEPPSTPGLPAPEEPGAGQIVIALHGLSVATSGDYRRVRVHEGRQHAHTIDPRTGHPLANGVAQVSVIHAECMWADAWSTALGVLGEEDGLALAEAQGLAARVLTRTEDGRLRERLSTPLQRMLE